MRRTPPITGLPCTAANPAAYRIALLLIASLLTVTGCIGPGSKCRVMVSNVSEVPLRLVTVELPQGNPLSFKDIAPDSTSQAKTSQSGMNQHTSIQVTTAGNEMKRAKIDLGKPVPENFRGQVIFQIEAENRIHTFVIPNKKSDDGGDLPWDIPPTWTAAPSLPGMSGE